MIAALLFIALAMPLCASMAGFVVWLGDRNQPLDDGQLYRSFMLILMMCMVLALGISRTPTVRMRLDPQFRLQTELATHPLYSTLQRLAPDDHRRLAAFLAGQMALGATLSDAFLQARPLLTQMTNQLMGFADQTTRLRWARVTTDGLRELQSRDPLLCYRSLTSEPLDPQWLAQAFSADNTQAFQQAVMAVYESADRGMRHQRTPGEQPADFNQAALEYRAIEEIILQRFGEPVSRQLSKKRFPAPPIEPPGQMCAARIAQLDAMLQRPQPLAAMLVDSVLR